MGTLKSFEDNPIRSIWIEEDEEWYFSIVDVVGVLTKSENPKRYWSDLKRKIKEEVLGIQTYDESVHLDEEQLLPNYKKMKLKSVDGKMRLTDVANVEQLFRLIQSIPSPKAEPFKLWLASVGKDRVNEIIDPELTIDRALETYLEKGYSREWINQRLQAIQVRKELTDCWQDHGIKNNKEFAILTNEITKAWAGKSIKDYKNFKGLKKENLRDNMTSTELILNMLAEVATKDIAEAKNPYGLQENKKIAKEGGSIAKEAKKAIEKQTGKPVITSKNATNKAELLTEVINNIGDKD